MFRAECPFPRAGVNWSCRPETHRVLCHSVARSGGSGRVQERCALRGPYGSPGDGFLDFGSAEGLSLFPPVNSLLCDLIATAAPSPLLRERVFPPPCPR